MCQCLYDRSVTCISPPLAETPETPSTPSAPDFRPPPFADCHKTKPAPVSADRCSDFKRPSKAPVWHLIVAHCCPCGRARSTENGEANTTSTSTDNLGLLWSLLLGFKVSCGQILHGQTIKDQIHVLYYTFNGNAAGDYSREPKHRNPNIQISRCVHCR